MSISGNIPLILPQTSSSIQIPTASLDNTINTTALPHMLFNTIIPPPSAGIISQHPITNPEPIQILPTNCAITESQNPNLTETSNEMPPPVQLYDINNPPIPISHLMGGNPYPSLNRVPSNIVQSFSPVFIQPQHNSVEGGDIYNDYVNNPYNLTLQDQVTPASPTKEQNLSPEKLNNATPLMATDSSSSNNVFQSTNYFNTESSGAIPPGSEMLFGGS